MGNDTFQNGGQMNKVLENTKYKLPLIYSVVLFLEHSNYIPTGPSYLIFIYIEGLGSRLKYLHTGFFIYINAKFNTQTSLRT